MRNYLDIPALSPIQKYVFPWGILDVLLTQKSPIDLPRLAMTDRKDAYFFLLNYGYDADDPRFAELEAGSLSKPFGLDDLETALRNVC